MAGRFVGKSVASQEDDIRFGTIAVSRGMVSKARVEEGLRALRSGESLRPDLAGYLEEKGYLTAMQVEMIRGEMGGAGEPQRRTLGHYELLDLVGKGGMGKVYRARQLSMDRVVALKILDPDRTSHEAFRKRFIREARAAAALNHANIVRAIDAGEADGILYFVMEYIEAENVAQLLRKHGPMEEGRAVDIVLQMAHALAHADRHRLVHRDVKPENILIDLGGVAKLTDLGLAKSTEAGDERITQTGRAMGTPYYISPEQIRLFHDLDIRADLYSLGATFYHMLTGVPPFYAESPAAIVSMHLTAPLVPPRRHNPALSQGVCDVIARMMEKDRERRFQTPSEVIAALESLRCGAPLGLAAPPPPPDRNAPASPFADPGTAPPPSAPDKNRAGPGTIAAVVVLGGIALAAFLFLATGGDDADEGIDAPWVDGGAGAPAEPAPERPRPDRPDRPAPRVGPVERTGEEDYRQVRRFLEDNPRAFREGLRRLDELVREHEGGSIALLARKDREALQARLDVEAGRALKELKQKARELENRRRFGEARAVFEAFPEELLTGLWERKVQRQAALTRERGRLALQAHLDRARSHLEEDRFARARRELETAREYGLPEAGEAIDELLAGIAAREESRAETAFLRGFFDAAVSRDLLEAESYVARWQKDDKAAVVEGLLRDCLGYLAAIRDLLARRSAALVRAKGKPVSFLLKNGRRVEGRLAAVADGKVEVALAGRARVSTSFAVEDLGVAALASLAGGPDAGAWHAVAVFQLFHLGDFEAARQALRRAREAGADADRLAGLLEDLEAQRMEALLGRAEKSAGRRPDRCLAALRALVESHRGAGRFAAVESRVRDLLGRVRPGDGGPAPSLETHARLRGLPGGKVRHLWDFETADQLEDFRVRAGVFRVEDGVLRQSASWEGEGPLPEAEVPGRWGAFTAEAEFRVGRHARWAGLVFHDRGGGDCIAFQMIHTRKRPSPDKLYVGFFTPERSAETGRILFENGRPVLAVSEDDLWANPRPFDPGASHRLKVRVGGGKATGYFDGKPVGTLSLPGEEPGGMRLRLASPGAVRSLWIVPEPSGR